MTVNSSMMQAVSQLTSEYPSYSVYVTGHSLGAALSILGSLNIAVSMGLPVYVYNYGGVEIMYIIINLTQIRVLAIHNLLTIMILPFPNYGESSTSAILFHISHQNHLDSGMLLLKCGTTTAPMKYAIPREKIRIALIPKSI